MALNLVKKTEAVTALKEPTKYVESLEPVTELPGMVIHSHHSIESYPYGFILHSAEQSEDQKTKEMKYKIRKRYYPTVEQCVASAMNLEARETATMEDFIGKMQGVLDQLKSMDLDACLQALIHADKEESVLEGSDG